MPTRLVMFAAVPMATIAWAGLGLIGTAGAHPEVAGAGFIGAGAIQLLILHRLLRIESRLSFLEGKTGARRPPTDGPEVEAAPTERPDGEPEHLRRRLGGPRAPG